MKRQLQLMEVKLDKLQKQTNGQAGCAAERHLVSGPSKGRLAKGPAPQPEAIVLMPNNRPTICTYDQQNCIAITSRVHYDIGGYDYHPNTPATVPQRLDDGTNVRRARIGLQGKFLSDWNYALIYDFGGSSDGFGGTASAGGAPVGFLPGGATSGIENAYLSYTGLKPFGGKMVLEAGIVDVLWSLDEFNELQRHPVHGALLLTGDRDQHRRQRLPIRRRRALVQRRVLGRRLRHWADHGRYPFSLQHQSAWHHRATWCGRARRGASRQRQGILATYWCRRRIPDRSAAQPRRQHADPDPAGTGPNCASTPPRSYRREHWPAFPALKSTAPKPPPLGGRCIFQGEYFWFNVDRKFLLNLPSVNFQGGYAEAAFVLTGESRAYQPATASYGGVIPKNRFRSTGGGWGAWEIAARSPPST